MADEDWATLAGLREIARVRAERIPGWQAPVAYAVGYRGDDGWHFPHVNQPSGTHGLPAVILALDATLTARGPGGERQITAADAGYGDITLPPQDCA